MAQCKMCGKKGFLLSVSVNGLCKSCDPIVVMDIQQRGRIINDCMNLIDKSKNIDTRLSRCELLIKHAKALLEYEHKEIPTLNPSPSQLLSNYTSILTQLTQESQKTQIVICPYCNTLLDKMPTQKKKCPSCGNDIYVRTEYPSRKKLLLTKEQVDKLDAQRTLEREKEAEKIRTEMAANNKRALKQYKTEGLKRVEIYTAQDERCCPTCAKAAGVYPIDKALTLPIRGCTNPNGCRCTYLPVVD